MGSAGNEPGARPANSKTRIPVNGGGAVIVNEYCNAKYQVN
jgi:hypothetical protein